MAGGFRFRLEAVRTIRRRARDAQQRVVADAIRELTSVENRIGDLTAQLRQSVEEMRDRRREPQLNLLEIRSQQVHSGRLQRRILESQEELTARREVLSDHRRALADAVKQLDVIEKLRDKQWATYINRNRAAEQAAADEAAAVMHRRQADRCEVEI